MYAITTQLNDKSKHFTFTSEYYRKRIKTMFLPLIGIEVGVLACYFEKSSTSLGGITPEIWTYFIQILFAHCIYGTDRLWDYRISRNKNEIKDTDVFKYLSLKQNENRVELTTIISFLAAVALLIYENQLQFIFPLFFCVYQYRDFKEMYPLLKPVLVALSFTATALWLPYLSVHEHVDVQTWMPTFMEMYAVSNLADISDSEEDEKNGIRTLPVIAGKQKSGMFSFMIGTGAALVYANNPNVHFLEPRDFLFQTQLIGSTIAPCIPKIVGFPKLGLRFKTIFKI